MEAVSFEDFDEINEISVRNIKKACMKHYGMSETMSCDALEQGISCSSVKQLPMLKRIHRRFIEGKVKDAPIEVSAGVGGRRKRAISDISQGENAGHGKTSVPQRASFQIPSKFVPQRLSVVDMLKLGKLITDTTTSFEIFNFDMSVIWNWWIS